MTRLAVTPGRQFCSVAQGRFDMSGFKNEVAIIGMGCTKFGELWDKDVKDLIIDACYEAFEDAGIEPEEVQAAWVGTLSQWAARISAVRYWLFP